MKRVRRCDIIITGPVSGKHVGRGKGLSHLMDANPLERRNVSRKTPGDGMLEITKPVAEKLLRQGNEFDLTTPAGDGRVTLTSVPCTCRGADNPHEHWFLRSELLKSLVPGSEVDLSLAGHRVTVEIV